MRKFGLLTFILAVFLALSMVLVACNSDAVGAHDHVWDNGTVTTEPTCQAEGLRTYSCTVEGCTQTKTEPIAKTPHNWDDGEITEQPTCQATGTKTYTCKNEGCNATKTEQLQKSSHNWDEGVLTVVPDFYTPGEKKYTCLTEGCGETRTESVEAHADFAEQYYFSLADSNKNNWSYGYVADFDAASTSYTFAQITQIDAQSNAWKATGVEISKGHISQNNANAAVMYTFKEVVKKGMQANVAISFVGDESATVVRAYLFVTNAGNTTKIELNQNGAKDWKYASENAYDLAQSDSFAVVFAGEGAGTFNFTLTAPCNHVWGEATELEPATCTGKGKKQYTCLNCGATKEEETDPIGHKWDGGEITKNPTETEKGERTFNCLNGCGETKKEDIPMLLPSNFVSANFTVDFDSVYSGENVAWQAGIVDFTDDAKFAFTPLTAKDDAFRNSDPWIEIRGDWAAINGMAGIAYTFGADAKVDLSFSLTRRGDADFAVRWAVKNERGAIVSNDGRASWAGKISEINGPVIINETIDFHAGETIYILINHEGGGDQCEYTYTLTKHSDEPQTAFAEFKKDFHAGDTTNRWEYGSSEYAWDTTKEIKIGNESFTYAPGAYNADTQAWESGDASIKAGSVDIRNNATIVYTFGGDMTVNIYLTFKGETGKTVHSALRMIIVDNGGNGVKKLETFDVGSNTKNEWTATFANVQVKADYKIYIIFFEESGSDSTIAEFDCKFTSDQAQGGEEPAEPSEPEVPSTPFDGADLAEDFASTIEGNVTGWTFGTVKYTFETETFVFTEIAANAGKTAYESGENSLNGVGATVKDGMMGIAYTFGSDAKVDVKFVITCEATAKFSVRWAIRNRAGEMINGENGKANWGGDTGEAGNYTLDQTVDVHMGDTLYILINHETGEQCAYTYKLTKHSEESEEPPTEGTTVTFADEFEAALAGENNDWSVGNVDYKFGEQETFEFFKTDRKNGGNDAFVNVDGKPFFEMKGDWAAIEAYAAIAYTFKGTGDAHFKFDITGLGAATFSVRYAVISASGAAKTGPDFAGNDAHVTAEHDITVEAGDTLYIIINRESGGDDNKCNYTFELTKHFDDSELPPTAEDTTVNFAEDFDLESQGKFNGWEIGYATYHWGGEPNPDTFEFTAITGKNEHGDAYKNGDPFMEVKGDWAALGGMLAIAYHFDEAQTIDINFLLNRAEGNSDGVFSVRWAVKSEDGTIVSSDNGQASWVGNNAEKGSLTFQKEITLKSGDTLFILINHDDGGDQCNFSLELNAKA